MYEQPRTSVVGRIIWLVVSLLVIAGIVWLVLWFFFWRHQAKPTLSPSNTVTSVTQKANETIDNVRRSNSSTTTPSSSTSSSSQSSPTTPVDTAPTTTPSTSSGNGHTSSTATTISNSSAAVSSDTSATSTLVNTGPGDVITPVIVAIVGGSVWYQLRVRKQLRLTAYRSEV